MAVAYSIDLLERVVRAYQAGEGTQAQIAQRFQVSPSFVQRLLRRHRQSGQVTAKGRGGNHQPKIQGEHLDLGVIEASLQRGAISEGEAPRTPISRLFS